MLKSKTFSLNSQKFQSKSRNYWYKSGRFRLKSQKDVGKDLEGLLKISKVLIKILNFSVKTLVLVKGSKSSVQILNQDFVQNLNDIDKNHQRFSSESRMI